MEGKRKVRRKVPAAADNAAHPISTPTLDDTSPPPSPPSHTFILPEIFSPLPTFPFVCAAILSPLCCFLARVTRLVSTGVSCSNTALLLLLSDLPPGGATWAFQDFTATAALLMTSRIASASAFLMAKVSLTLFQCSSNTALLLLPLRLRL